MTPSSAPSKPASTHKVGLLTCIFLVLAIMVGNGIYTNLGLQLVTISSGFGILILWTLGGICALCGALSYAELSALMPHSGGEYYYLSRIYHPALGTMGGIITQYGGFVAPTALASMAFAKYAAALFPSLNPTATAIGLVTLVTGAHLINIGFSAAFQDAITALKFLLIAGIIFIGFRYASESPTIFLPSMASFKELLQPSSGVALIFCYYAYSGWSSATYIADDVSSSQKTVGRSLVIGTLLVTLIYLLINAIFLMSAPVSELRGVLDVGRVAGTHLLGEQGGKIMAGLIAIGLVAGVSGMVWIAPRITQTMGKDLPALRFFSHVSASNIPIRAMLVQYVLVVLLLATSSFKIVLVSSQFTLIFCELLGVLGVIALRRQHRDVKDPSLLKVPLGLPGGFRCPLYPLPQIIFGVVSLVALGYTASTNPQEAFIGIGVILFGIALYPLFRRGRKN